MRKDSKESVWPFYQPASFRHWTKRKMNPVPVQTAVKTKKRLALCYLISTAVMLHYCIFAYGTKKHIPTVENNLDPALENFLMIANNDETKATILSFDQFKLKTVEYFDQKEWEKARREE